MRVLIVSIFCLMAVSGNTFAGFDDILKEVLVETGNQVIGTNDYSYAPGEVIIKQENYAVYYSGSEEIGGNRTLLLSLVTDQGVVLLKYPSPESIQIRKFKLQVLQFDNSGIKVKVLQKKTE